MAKGLTAKEHPEEEKEAVVLLSTGSACERASPPMAHERCIRCLDK